MDKVPEDRSARLTFLESWAREQQRRPYAGEIARVAAQARQRTGQVDSAEGVAVIPVVVTKPSHLPADRGAVFSELMAGLRKHEWADPIVSECDEWRYIAPKAMDLGRAHRPEAPWLLYMEDDVILGPDFGLIPELLREAHERFPDVGIVNFFSVSFDKPGWSIHPMEHFILTQCFAIRNSDHLAGFRAFIDEAVTQGAAKRSTTQPSQAYEIQDQAVRSFLATEYEVHAVWCPSLVQHADVRSLGFDRPYNLISMSYERAYG